MTQKTNHCQHIEISSSQRRNGHNQNRNKSNRKKENSVPANHTKMYLFTVKVVLVHDHNKSYEKTLAANITKGK